MAVVNLNNSPTGDLVYIGRPSKWGNPFVIGRDGTRREVIEKYRDHVTSDPLLMESLHELRGKDLACWCHPLPCHGDVLEELLDEGTLDGIFSDDK